MKNTEYNAKMEAANIDPKLAKSLFNMASNDMRKARIEGEIFVTQTQHGTLIVRDSCNVLEIRTAGINSKLLFSSQTLADAARFLATCYTLA